MLIAIIALSGTVILAAMGRARGPETAGTDVYLETAAPAEEFVSAPVADAAEPATAKAPAPTPEAKAVVAPVLETEVATDVVSAPPPAVIATTDVAGGNNRRGNGLDDHGDHGDHLRLPRLR